MSKSIGVEDLEKELSGILSDYAAVTSEGMKKAVRKAGSFARKEIRKNSPESTGKYKESWTVRKVGETTQSLSVVVHSKNRYYITHLLENGHVLRNGGRSRNFPHIAPAEEKAARLLEEEIKKEVKHD